MIRTWTCPVCEEPGDSCNCGVDKQPGICGGRWVVRGSRVWVSSVACFRDRTVENYPHLSHELVGKVIRWLDAGGLRVLYEDLIEEICGELTQVEQFHALARVCRQAGDDGEELFTEWWARVGRTVWRSTEVA